MTIRDIFSRRNIDLNRNEEEALERYWSSLQKKRSTPQTPRHSEQDIAVTFDPRSSTDG